MPYDICTRAQALALRNRGVPYADITAETGIKKRQIQNIHAEAKKRGWVPGQPILDVHVADKPRSGRPRNKPLVPEELVEG